MKKGAAALLATMVAPGSVKALDRHTVQFSLTKPAAIFLAVVPEVHVVNSALLKKHEKDGDWGAAWLTGNEAGSGSYALSRYDIADCLALSVCCCCAAGAGWWDAASAWP